jgi:disulfide bond formation protein DsbB
VLLGIICLALIGGALYMQVVLGEAPCPLCILQALCAAVDCAVRVHRRGHAQRRNHPVRRPGGDLRDRRRAGGRASCVHPVLSPVSCGIDVLQPIVDDLPLAKIFPLGFQVDGFCSTPYPPMLGLSLAQWALVAFVLVVILVPLGIYRNRQRKA